ncbi:MAG: CDP-diacylglycerol--glycerol-3-phosphate 3-phosphatidyltransferase [Candidatus Abyssobacteria bacterium SURF_5]|uniref:CDP-diacylglycerol--glycerol-3-phosphate 3-phosphatidyltransferase n=1 Tax=Abyssobacteria bacterium (strain SURF_5) TaxID=2093360 RepID=A0A3A4N892_ABYX5|nr:MAG: CDP-diacylglycerol--glycerol-3-phosphate 3-phosphatidyltransferase [Candidatus Abyssubacteria bacterium SURF_5]
MNLPNKLTLIRLGLVPLLLLFLSVDNIYSHSLALITFIGASLTDYYDGKIARERAIETDFGRLMDPLADKILTSAAFIYFVGSYPYIPAWIVTVIIAREFAVSGIRMLALMKGKVVAADRAGKLKTISQLTVIIAILNVIISKKIIVSVSSYWTSIEFWAKLGIHILVAITLVMTVYSGYNYLRANRHLFWESLRSNNSNRLDQIIEP